MKDCHFGNVMESCIPIWFMLQRTSKNFLINFFQILEHFLVEWINIHGILSLFHISKHNLASGFKTHNMTMSFMVAVLYPNCDCTPLLSFRFRSIFGVFYNLLFNLPSCNLMFFEACVQSHNRFRGSVAIKTL
jgi:hypothetical protein